MTHEQQSKLLGEFYAEKKNILKLKGEDYANEDVLSNFKTAGANIGISPELQCLSLIATKVARLGNLLSGKTPNNESISDSILDLSNYTDLLYCLVNENVADMVKVSKEKPRSILKAIMAADEKDALYEPQTKRWENVAPIKDAYEPKVGEFISHQDTRDTYEIIKVEDKCVIGKSITHSHFLISINKKQIDNAEFTTERNSSKKIYLL